MYSGHTRASESQFQSVVILLTMSKDQDRGDFRSELKEEWGVASKPP